VGWTAYVRCAHYLDGTLDGLRKTHRTLQKRYCQAFRCNRQFPVVRERAGDLAQRGGSSRSADIGGRVVAIAHSAKTIGLLENELIVRMPSRSGRNGTSVIRLSCPSETKGARQPGWAKIPASVNYEQTSYGYETFATGRIGRQNRILASDGAIPRLVLDAPGKHPGDLNWHERRERQRYRAIHPYLPRLLEQLMDSRSTVLYGNSPRRHHCQHLRDRSDFLVVGFRVSREVVDGEVSHPGRSVPCLLGDLGGGYIARRSSSSRRGCVGRCRNTAGTTEDRACVVWVASRPVDRNAIWFSFEKKGSQSR